MARRVQQVSTGKVQWQRQAKTAPFANLGNPLQHLLARQQVQPPNLIIMAEDMGVPNTLRILEQLQAITGEDRYRPTMWLKRRSRLSLPIHTGG